ncbi:hypothetical protein N7520_000029 [Penicillium odoratum]|uniref:uncharacterized protein n=1 Tax=Penicillium odoratum TaxID=1167516 RepID=UPI0025481DC9|nr:uncharacterized protein N7520_000029 [Penicillium odoratum]KAJ5776783.1 hypothetical protein N7520_000029 [Penicillium odoratum]
MRPFIRRYFPYLLGLCSAGGYYGSGSRKQAHPLSSLPRGEQPDFSNRDLHYSTALTTSRNAPDNDSDEQTLFPKIDALKGVDGIMRTVEFDVEDMSTEMR